MKLKSLSPANVLSRHKKKKTKQKHINDSVDFATVVTRRVQMASFTQKNKTLKKAVRLWLSSLYHSDPRCQVNLFYESTAKAALREQQQSSNSSLSLGSKKKEKSSKRFLTKTISRTIRKGAQSQMRMSVGRNFVGNLLTPKNDNDDVKDNNERKGSAETLLTTSDHDQDEDEDDVVSTDSSSSSVEEQQQEPREQQSSSHSSTTRSPPSRAALLNSSAYNKHNNIDESKGNLAELLTGRPAVFTVWRPTSREAIRLMICGQAVGKGLEIKGKSAKCGRLSGFVPFLQIYEEDHKEQIRTLPRDGRVQVFFHSSEQRQVVLEALQPLLDEFQEAAQGARHRVTKMVRNKFLFSTRSGLNDHHSTTTNGEEKQPGLFRRVVRRMSAEFSVSDVSESVREELEDEIFAESDDDGGSAISSSSITYEEEEEEKEEKHDNKPPSPATTKPQPHQYLLPPKQVEPLVLRSDHQPQALLQKKHIEPLSTKSEHLHPPRRHHHQKYKVDPYDDDETVQSSTSSVGSFVSSLSCALPARRGGKKKNKKASMFGSKRQTTPETKIMWNPTEKSEMKQDHDHAAASSRMGVNRGNSFMTSAMEMKQTIDGVAQGVLSSRAEMKQQVEAMAQAALSKASETHETVQQKAAETRDAVQQTIKDRKAAFQRLMALDMDDYSVETIDKYAESGSKYGLELSDRLLWVALVQDKDITRPEGSDWETGRPSQPAFQDMNWNAIYQTRKNQTKPSGLPRPGFNNSRRKKEPRVVLVQSCEEDPLDPRGLIMAYEEEGRVLPVVSDFDCFTMGTRGYDYDSPLPKKQVQLVEWCLDNIKQVFELQEKDQSVNWTLRWLDVLKQHALKGFHPEIPQYGFGDGKSYGIVEDAVASLKKTGAVRHGAESFNYYFPQDLDEEFLIVSESVFDDQQLPWRYVNVEQLQEFLLERIYDGFTFPLNPKWILCDPNWKPLYDELLSSKQKQVQQSLNVWYPPTIREKIEAIHKQYPNGFVHERTGDEYDDADDMIDGTAAMDLATLELSQYMVLRRAKMKMIAVAGFSRLLVRVREKRRRKEEAERQEESALGSDGEDDDDSDEFGRFVSI